MSTLRYNSRYGLSRRPAAARHSPPCPPPPAEAFPKAGFWQRFQHAHAAELRWYRAIFIGKLSEASDFFLARWLFLRLLGIIYLIAFLSLWWQLHGLVGSRGILPASDFLTAVYDKLGIVAYWTVPTLCWLGASDACLHALCGAGAALSVFLILGVAPIPSLIGLWTLYLSLSTVCRVFLGYQWDILLLETGFLAILLAPGQLLPRLSQERKPSRLALFLCYWLLFRLMFASGMVKLTSGDMIWRKLTALTVHYQTQPIPNPLSWTAHQFPEWFQQACVAVMFVIELALPFLIFGPRRLRFLAGAGIVFLMTLIILTGNYCFFNLLTIALCVLLLDDHFLRPLLPRKLFSTPATPQPRTIANLVVTVIATVVIVPLSIVQMKPRVFRLDLSPMEERFANWTSPYRTVNSYGLFANMTETRPEIVISGSDNRVDWQPYEFRWKPGELRRVPGQVAPHQPRIDWQMWFEALNYERGGKPTEWFRGFLIRLLEGEPEVLRLLETNPFPRTPPKFVRAEGYEYRFTNEEERRASGAYWQRKFLGTYVYPSSLPAKTQ